MTDQPDAENPPGVKMSLEQALAALDTGGYPGVRFNAPEAGLVGMVRWEVHKRRESGDTVDRYFMLLRWVPFDGDSQHVAEVELMQRDRAWIEVTDESSGVRAESGDDRGEVDRPEGQESGERRGEGSGPDSPVQPQSGCA